MQIDALWFIRMPRESLKLKNLDFKCNDPVINETREEEGKKTSVSYRITNMKYFGDVRYYFHGVRCMSSINGNFYGK